MCDSKFDKCPRGPVCHVPTEHDDFAPFGSAKPCDALDKFSLSVSRDARKPENFPLTKLERKSESWSFIFHRLRYQIFYVDGFVFSSNRWSFHVFRHSFAKGFSRKLAFVRVRNRLSALGLAEFEYGHPIRNRKDFFHLVGNKYDTFSLLRHRSKDHKKMIRLMWRQKGGRLIQ